MKSTYILFLVATLLYSCSKKDNDTITTFKGVALISSNNEPVSVGNIAINGYENTSIIGPDRQRFSSATGTNADGTFNIQITTQGNVDYLVMQVKIPGAFSTTECIPFSCFGLKPGKDYSDLILYATPTVN